MVRTYDNWIAGERVSTGRRAPVIDPFTGDAVGEIAVAGPREVERAIESAVDAFEITRGQTARERERALLAMAGGLAERWDEAAARIVSESGLPRADAGREVERAIEAIGLAAGEARRRSTAHVPVDGPDGAERSALVRRVPRGPVVVGGAIHAPLAAVARRAAPALAAGCAVIVAPPRRTPLSSLLLAEVAARAGVAHGALNVIHPSDEALTRLAGDPRIAAALLTEPDGGGPTLVHRDSAWGESVSRVAAGAYRAAGQAAPRVQQVLIDEVVADEWLAALVDRADGLRMGDPRDPHTEVGPLIDDGAADRVEEWLARAVEAGGRVATGGVREGRFVRPAVVVDLPQNAAVRGEELRGPVIVADRYHDFAEAVARAGRAGATQAGVFTQDVRRIDYAVRHLEVGGVIVNDHPAFRAEALSWTPPGGRSEGIAQLVDAVSEERIVVVDARPAARRPPGTAR